MVEKYNKVEDVRLAPLAFTVVFAFVSVAIFLLGTVSTGAFPKVTGAYEIRQNP